MASANSRRISSLEAVHAAYVHGRRSGVVAAMLGSRVAIGGRILDIGCGDGLVSATVAEITRSQVVGVETQMRANCRIAATLFDGQHLPFPDDAFDVAMLVDVLHHADNGMELLREAARVAPTIVIKDHVRDGVLARQTLLFMDTVSNARFGMAIPGRYWAADEWREAIKGAGLAIDSWTTDVPLYPWWAKWIFGRKLHVIARLRRASAIR